MTAQEIKRKLIAILSADVKGYSRLMGEDEKGTVRTLSAYKEVMTGLIEHHRGRVAATAGDSMLGEFASVVDAVECAVDIQKELKTRNAELPENRRMDFRIGVNLGDVIEDREQIFGDGVNIAARVQGLADGGGICISGSAHEQVENKVAISFEYLGEHMVKNITRPIRVYRVIVQPGVAYEMDKKLDLPEKPSIAVLPFVNMSGDQEQEYFSDGITEDLITDLSKVSGLFVISRNSVFLYKGKAAKVQEVGRELGVRFILEGSVRKVGNRVRITAQLVDAITGGHLWAERYDRELTDIFRLQDEVTREIVAALSLNLTRGEEGRLARRDTDNVVAYDHVLRGMEHHWRYTKEANAQAQALFQKAIELDPGYALAYSWLGLTVLHSWTQGWNRDLRALADAFELAQKAIALDDSLAEAHRILGDVYLYRKQHEEAIRELKTAIALNPNYADAFAGLGDVLNWAGRAQEAIDLVKTAMRLNPHHHAWYFFTLGLSYLSLYRTDEAIEVLKRGIIRNPDFLGIHLALAGLYAEIGDREKARIAAEEVLRISPSFSLKVFHEMVPTKDELMIERMTDLLRKAGLE